MGVTGPLKKPKTDPSFTPSVESKIPKFSVQLMDYHSFKKVLRADPEILKLHNFGPKPVQMAKWRTLFQFSNFIWNIFVSTLFFIITQKFKKSLEQILRH